MVGEARVRLAEANRLAVLPSRARVGVWRRTARPELAGRRAPRPAVDCRHPDLSAALFRLAAIGAWILLASQILVWSRLSVLRARYEVSAARQMVSKLEEQQRRLQIEAELLRDPANIGREASTRLGMRPPGPGEMVAVR